MWLCVAREWLGKSRAGFRAGKTGLVAGHRSNGGVGVGLAQLGDRTGGLEGEWRLSWPVRASAPRYSH